LLDRLEKAEAELAEVRACLADCADDIEAEAEAKRGTVLSRTTERDLALVRHARAILSRGDEGEPPQ
jgi:hypothetical protein